MRLLFSFLFVPVPHRHGNYYAGEFLASICQGSLESLSRSQIAETELKPFSLNRNRKYLFPEGQSLISPEEISFRSVWVDELGNVCQGTDQYLFDADGNLTQIDQLVQSSTGETLSHRRLESDQGNHWSEIRQAPALGDYDSSQTSQDSPWDIFFRVDDDLLVPTGGEICVAWNGVGKGSYTMGDSYWLEAKTENGWQRLLGNDVTFPFGVTLNTLSSNTQMFRLDWSDAYGSLESGIYRMGTRFYNGSESIIQYAQFSIYPTGGTYGEGSEAAMARVEAAIDHLKTASYHVVKTQSLGTEMARTEEYWHYGDNLGVAFFLDAGSYSHCFVESGDDSLWDGWYCYSYYPGPYDSFYFPEGRSVISPNEVTFLFSYSSSSESNPLRRYTYRFDDQGNVTEIEHVGFDTMWGGFVTRYTFVDTPESEIQQTIAKMQAGDYQPSQQ